MWKLFEIQILVFINKILLEHRHTHLHVVYGCFHASMAKLSRADRDLQSLKYLLSGFLQKKYTYPVLI